jgi:hypothetical protein
VPRRVNTLRSSSAQANLRRQAPDGAAAMQGAFLSALSRRVATNPSGTITLPTGVAKVTEIGQVLVAIARALDGERRRP